MAQVETKMTIKDDTLAFYREHTDVMDKAVDDMAKDGLMFSRVLVPRKDGDLYRSGEVVAEGKMHRTVYYGRSGPAGDYAAVQEEGQRAGARPFKKYSTPGTGKKFLERGVKKVIKKAETYLIMAARRIK